MAGLALNAWELTCYCFIFIVGLFGNLLVCFVVLKSPAEFRFAKFNIYLFALATVDLCLAVVCLPVYLFSTSNFPHPNGYGGTVFCKIFTGYFLPYWMGAASIYILVLISFERFEAVSNPLLSRVRSTKMKIRSNIAFACLSGFIVQLPTIIGLQYTPDKDKATIGSFCMYIWKDRATSSSIYAVVFTLLYVVPALIFIANFFRIRKCISKLDTNLRHCLADRRCVHGIMNNKRRTIRIVFVTSVAFFVCWTPNSIMYFLFQFGGAAEVAWDSNIYQVCIVLGYFNSCINPILYAFQSKKFRTHCKTIITKAFGISSPRKIRCPRQVLEPFTSTSDKDMLVRFEI